MSETCKNTRPHRICIWPTDGDVRRSLSCDFINGWLHWSQRKAANELAASDSYTDEVGIKMLIGLEESINNAYGMWEQCQ